MKQMMSAIRKATRVMLTGGLLAALAAAGTGCERRESGTAGADVKPQRGQAGQQGREGTAQQPPGTTGQQGQPGAPGQQQLQAETIRDPLVILSTPQRTALIGRNVDLAGVPIQKLSNEQVFWVGPTADRAVPVLIDEQLRGALKEKLEKGEQVTVQGELRQVPAVDVLEKQWDLSRDEAETIARSQVYLHARNITVGAAPQQGAQPQQGQPGTQRPGAPQGAEPATPRGAQPGNKQPGR